MGCAGRLPDTTGSTSCTTGWSKHPIQLPRQRRQVLHGWLEKDGSGGGGGVYVDWTDVGGALPRASRLCPKQLQPECRQLPLKDANDLPARAMYIIRQAGLFSYVMQGGRDVAMGTPWIER